MTASDISQGPLIYALPPRWRPWAYLLRLDRPVGWQLLLAPCWMGFALTAFLGLTSTLGDWGVAVLCLPGAVIMRAAGCIINDLWDQDIDAKIARTAQRPLANGDLSRLQACIALVICLLLGGLILLCFKTETILWGLASLPVIILYPLAKRYLDCPQAVLGIAFSWGVPIASIQILGDVPLPMLLLWAGCGFWIIGYDTIYAFQDCADDKRAGVRSFALWLGYARGRTGVALAYSLAFAFWIGAWSLAIPETDTDLGRLIAGIGGIGFVAVAFWTANQIMNWKVDNPKDCLRVFRLAPWTGFALAGVWVLSSACLFVS